MSIPDQPQPTTPAPDTSTQTSLALKERVFAFACQGMRSPAIARALNVPERTARSWIQQARSEMAEDRKAMRRTDLPLAIERQLAISAAAWQGYERAARAEQCALSYLERPPAEDEPVPLTRFTAAGARYLTVAQSAQREAARLQDLYGVPKPEEPQQLPFLVISKIPERPGELSDDEREAWDAFMAWWHLRRKDSQATFTYPPSPLRPSNSQPPSSASPSASASSSASISASSANSVVNSSASVSSVVNAPPPPAESEKPAETANTSTEITDIPGIATYPQDLTNPALVTPQLRQYLTPGSEVLYMPAPPNTAQRKASASPRHRAPQLGVPPPRH